METYSVGDEVRITDFYRANYRNWAQALENSKGVVKFAKKKTVLLEDIGKDERPIYQAKYGFLSEFPLWELHIEIGEKVYIVSQLGYTK